MKPENNNKEIERLNIELQEQRLLNETLKHELEAQALAIEYLTKKIEINKVLNNFNTYSISAAAADLLIDPNPVEIICSGEKADTSEKYKIRLMNVLAVYSDGRLKRIFLKNLVHPSSGGKGKTILNVDRNGENFDTLLFKLQKGGERLLRVHKSFAINIYHYIYSEKLAFQLKENLRTKENTQIQVVPVGSIFQKSVYDNRIFEIEKLKDYIKDYQNVQYEYGLFLKKLEESGLGE